MFTDIWKLPFPKYTDIRKALWFPVEHHFCQYMKILIYYFRKGGISFLCFYLLAIRIQDLLLQLHQKSSQYDLVSHALRDDLKSCISYNHIKLYLKIFSILASSVLETIIIQILASTSWIRFSNTITKCKCTYLTSAYVESEWKC